MLQEQEITRISGSQNLSVDVRVVAAANQELQERVRSREFREDLYYRLNVVPIQPCAAAGTQRGSSPWWNTFWSGPVPNLKYPQTMRQAMDLLCSYGWPGNVRELENTIKRARSVR